MRLLACGGVWLNFHHNILADHVLNQSVFYCATLLSVANICPLLS